MNRFPRVLVVRQGYDPEQVDALIRRIEGTLGRGALDGDPVTADEIRDARFRVKRGGYHEMAVDFALEAFIVAVETRTTGMSARRPPGEPPAGGESGGGPVAASAAPPAPDDEPVERVGPAADRAEVQATRVERVAFRAGRLGMGYDEDEVDAFLDRIVATLRGTTGQPLTAREVREVTFSIVLFKPGYAVGEVDEFLAELADVIARCHAAE